MKWAHNFTWPHLPLGCSQNALEPTCTNPEKAEKLDILFKSFCGTIVKPFRSYKSSYLQQKRLLELRLQQPFANRGGSINPTSQREPYLSKTRLPVADAKHCAHRNYFTIITAVQTANDRDLAHHARIKTKGQRRPRPCRRA